MKGSSNVLSTNFQSWEKAKEGLNWNTQYKLRWKHAKISKIQQKSQYV